MDANCGTLPMGASHGGRIEAVLLPPEARLTCLPRHFGAQCIAVENAVCDMMRRLCPLYRGDYWEFYQLSNGGFYMAPTAVERYRLECDGNGFAGEFGANATGMGVCAMAYSQLSFWRGGARAAEMYYRLRDFIDLQPEARRLYALLD
ncbi:antirestriction protein [Duganella sp. Dugasp56]|uniref:antirestriction protein n=1 Tax=Duganella sp. Dugasp56 TaxID=3243046 RepID=UPI0039B0AE7E